MIFEWFGDFLKFASLEIAYFAYSSSFQYCLATSATKLPEKNVLVQNWARLGPNWAQNGVFVDFLNFSSLEIDDFAY